MEHATNTRYMKISYQSLFWGKEKNKVTNTNITNPHLRWNSRKCNQSKTKILLFKKKYKLYNTNQSGNRLALDCNTLVTMCVEQCVSHSVLFYFCSISEKGHCVSTCRRMESLCCMLRGVQSFENWKSDVSENMFHYK